MSDKRISLDGLGMSREAMLELVNRMNKALPEKWELITTPAYGQVINPLALASQRIVEFNNPAFGLAAGATT